MGVDQVSQSGSDRLGFLSKIELAIERRRLLRSVSGLVHGQGEKALDRQGTLPPKEPVLIGLVGDSATNEFHPVFCRKANLQTLSGIAGDMVDVVVLGSDNFDSAYKATVRQKKYNVGFFYNLEVEWGDDKKESYPNGSPEIDRTGRVFLCNTGGSQGSLIGFDLNKRFPGKSLTDNGSGSVVKKSIAELGDIEVALKRARGMLRQR